MDALCHCIEAYINDNYNPLVEGIAHEGIKVIGGSLRQAVKNGNDGEARKTMAMGSLLGGLSMRKSLGVVHSVSHQLSTSV